MLTRCICQWIFCQQFEIWKEFIVVLMVLRVAQNHQNNKFSAFIRKFKLCFEPLIFCYLKFWWIFESIEKYYRYCDFTHISNRRKLSSLQEILASCIQACWKDINFWKSMYNQKRINWNDYNIRIDTRKSGVWTVLLKI